MAAPVATPRGTPAGLKADDGFGAFITFSGLAQLDIFEKDTGVPGLDGGDPIDTTTHHNVAYNTKAPRSLVDLTEFQVTAAYDPCVYDDLLAIVNIEKTITITFPDTSTLAFFGYLRAVEFAGLVNGTQPELTLTVVPTNVDPSDCTEAGPVVVCNGTC
jgi:hypothetical protein